MMHLITENGDSVIFLIFGKKIEIATTVKAK